MGSENKPTAPIVGVKTTKVKGAAVPLESGMGKKVISYDKNTLVRSQIVHPDPSVDAANWFANMAPKSASLIADQQLLYNAGYYGPSDVVMLGKRTAADVAALARAMSDANVNGETWKDTANFRIQMGDAGLIMGGGTTSTGSSSGGGSKAVAGTMNITGPQSARESLNALYLKYTGAKPTDSDFADAYAKLVDAQSKAPVKYGKQKIKGQWYSVQLSDSVNADTFLEQYVFNKVNFGSDQIGGSIGETLSTIDSYANDYGSKLTTQERGNFAKGIVDGTMTVNDVKKNLSERAKARYKAIAGSINENVDVRSLASDYISTMASVLEKDANTIKIDDVEKAISGDTTMSTSDWIAELKKRPEYNYTNNARNEAASFASGLAATFGYGQQV